MVYNGGNMFEKPLCGNPADQLQTVGRSERKRAP
jgi:hypothetical protein